MIMIEIGISIEIVTRDILDLTRKIDDQEVGLDLGTVIDEIGTEKGKRIDTKIDAIENVKGIGTEGETVTDLGINCEIIEDKQKLFV